MPRRLCPCAGCGAPLCLGARNGTGPNKVNIEMASRQPFQPSTAGAAVLGLLLTLSPATAAADGLYLSLGVGKVGHNDLVDKDNRSVHDTPVGRAALTYRVRVNEHVSLDSTVQHFSSLQADDGGLNWAGVELGVKF